jgi:hypothetical protein
MMYGAAKMQLIEEDAADRMNIELLAMKNFISKLEKDNDQSD